MRTLIAFIFILVFSCKNEGTSKASFQERDTAGVSMFSQLLENGNYKAVVTTTPKITRKEKEILDKFQSVLIKNEVLSEQMFRRRNEGIPYDELSKLGFSKGEIETLATVFEITDTLKAVEQIAISRSQNTVTFKGTGILSLLDSLRVNVIDTSASFNGTELAYYSSDSSYMVNDFLPNGESLSPVFALGRKKDGIASLVGFGEKYTVILGKLMNSKKLYLYLGMPKYKIIDGRPNTFYSIIFGE